MSYGIVVSLILNLGYSIVAMSAMQTAILSREEKGRMIAEKPNQIQRMDERFYKVACRNGHGMYEVIQRENSSWICNCLDFHYRELRCKHIIAVEISLKLREKVQESIIQPVTVTTCLFCHSSNLKKIGLRHNKYGDIQRFLCADCSSFQREVRIRADETQPARHKPRLCNFTSPVKVSETYLGHYA
jgi:transposase-like protein